MLTGGDFTIQMTCILVSGVAVDRCSSSVRDVLLVKGRQVYVVHMDVACAEGTSTAVSVPVHGSQLCVVA